MGNADSVDTIDLQRQLSALDSLELPFVFFDEKLHPQFLSSRGAITLGIRNRNALDQYANILQPLQHAARSLNSRTSSSIGTSVKPSNVHPVEELKLETAGRRSFDALVFSRPFNLACMEQNTPGIVTIFHDLTFFEPFTRTISQSRRNRGIFVLVSSFVGRSLVLGPNQRDIVAGYRAAESDFFKHHPGNVEIPLYSDLLDGLTTSVEIVDPFIVSSSKIIVDLKMPVLVSISRPNLLRIISHLLLETTDFVGPFGTTRLKGSIKDVPSSEVWKLGSGRVAEVTFIAERQTHVPIQASPLELYFYRKYMPIHYKVSVKPEDQSEESELLEDIISSHKALRSYSSSSASVSEESLSENLTVAGNLARACGVELRVKRPKPDWLVLSARFKLHGEKTPTA